MNISTFKEILNELNFTLLKRKFKISDFFSTFRGYLNNEKCTKKCGALDNIMFSNRKCFAQMRFKADFFCSVSVAFCFILNELIILFNYLVLTESFESIALKTNSTSQFSFLRTHRIDI